MMLILVVLAVVVFAAQKSTDVPANPAATLPPSRAYETSAFNPAGGLELQKTAVDPAADQQAMWLRIHNRGTAARATKPAERQGNNLDYVASGEIVPYIETLD